MLNFIRDLWGERLGKAILVGLLLVVLAVPVCIYVSVREDRQWEQFKVAHKCKIVSYVAPSSSVGYGTANGKAGVIVIASPGQTSWLCDDGVTYTR